MGAVKEPSRFQPQTIEEAKKALSLGLISIEEYVQISLSMEPLVDALSDRDMSVRRKAILELAKRRDRQSAANKLREMLQDEDEEVRLYAAEALDSLETDFQRRIYQVRKFLEQEPDNQKYLFELGVLFLNYADTLAEEGEIRKYSLSKARAAFDQLLSKAPDHIEYLYFHGRTLQLQGDLQGALANFKKILQKHPQHQASHLKMADIYYELGEYDSVAHCCRQLSQTDLSSQVGEVVKFWA